LLNWFLIPESEKIIYEEARFKLEQQLNSSGTKWSKTPNFYRYTIKRDGLSDFSF
jgi:hypothetical protein